MSPGPLDHGTPDGVPSGDAAPDGVASGHAGPDSVLSGDAVPDGVPSGDVLPAGLPSDDAGPDGVPFGDSGAHDAAPGDAGSAAGSSETGEAAQDVPLEGRITLLLTSPRSAVGLLNWAAWQRLRQADSVLAADPDPAWVGEFDAAGIHVQDVSGLPVGERAGQLVTQAAADGAGADVVWWGSPDGDPALTDALAEHLSRRAVAGRPPQIEVLTGSHDVPGARLLDLVAVMDTLRSPGGCPWDAEQTHSSLLPFLLEETHEVIEAVEGGDRDHLSEELGDLLLQVVFHARLAQEHATAPFGIDEVAAGIVAKLIRRHPHVFGADAPVPAEKLAEQPDDELDEDGTPYAADGGGRPEQVPAAQGGTGLTAGDVEQTWEQLKAAEKPQRAGFEGIPATLPALARAQKMLGRLERTETPEQVRGAVAMAAESDEVVIALLGAVLNARAQGLDAEAELRAALSRLPPPT